MSSKICLNMIVKNESATIVRCLQSVKRHIHSWVIVDTGSTDGTQELIREYLSDLPGVLHERPWVHFEHNRNEALALAKGKSDYLLFIDADEELICPEKCFLPKLELDKYLVEHRLKGYSFERALLISNDPAWRWEGVVHETILHPGEPSTVRLATLVVQCHPRKGGSNVLRHIELLEKAPKESRNVFYLAQSYFETSQYQRAYYWYEKRSTMGGWDQEIYWSLFRMALIQEYHLQEKPFIELYFRAYQFRPSRIEALYYLANYYSRNEQCFAAFWILKIALATPQSNDAVLVERWMYDWGADYLLLACAVELGKTSEVSIQASRLLKNKCLPALQREAIDTLLPT